MAEQRSNVQRICCDAVLIVVAEKSAYSHELIKRAFEKKGFKVAVPAGPAGDAGKIVIELDETLK